MLTKNSSISWVKKHSLTSKWNILFDKSPEWIAFKPQLGQKVYPCYSCKNMFSLKTTFQDHINRRIIIIKYKCPSCNNTLTFYNRCSFLLHTRKHYSLIEGAINLSNVDISVLPIELAGFGRDHNVPFLYDENEEYIDCETVHINSQFYHPEETEAGKQVVKLKPFNLVFHYRQDDFNIVLVLKQITSNIPLCEFVKKDNKSRMPRPKVPNLIPIEQIKEEPQDDVETPNEPAAVESAKETCPECKKSPETTMATHFGGTHKPEDSSLICRVCKYIATTPCSLQAHVRVHEQVAPFVCPECGAVLGDVIALTQHMDEVCFHLGKQVRFRCPASKCGKHFVLPHKYHQHFTTHFQLLNRCPKQEGLMTESEFAEHEQSHQNCAPTKVFKCLVCKEAPTFEKMAYVEHVAWHTKNREHCVYIYTCKHCRSYFKSRDTFDVHRRRCQKTLQNLALGQLPTVQIQCYICFQRMLIKEMQRKCPNCKRINYHPHGNSKADTCMLCKEELTVEHSKKCKYNNPVVTIKAIVGSDKDSDDAVSEKMSTSDVVESSSDSQKMEEASTPAGGNRKKRKKTSTPPSVKSSKKQAVEESVDLQADEPIAFDGTYHCKLCSFENTDREQFHVHIIKHRDNSTVYQCMECGECFVVKPSLVKHLMHYHKISDVADYMAKNKCCDQKAIEDLVTQIKLGVVERKGPLNENQCAVCLQQFDDSLSLSKHFRMHGMAFLMKSTK